MPWADQHCHLAAGADGDHEIAEARAAGVRVLINVGTSVKDSRRAIASAQSHEGVWATAGVHPHVASQGIAGLEELIGRPKVVAVGEAGLDYHYDNSPRRAQRDVFAAQIDVSNSRDLPLVVHSRAAWDDTFAVFDREGMPRRTVLHCFTGGVDEAQECLRRGAMLSFSGIVTFANAQEVRSAVSACPLDRLMIETDSPYLAPAPHRGKPNRPALVRLVGEAVAAAKDVSVDEVQSATWDTTRSFYALSDEDVAAVVQGCEPGEPVGAGRGEASARGGG